MSPMKREYLQNELRKLADAIEDPIIKAEIERRIPQWIIDHREMGQECPNCGAEICCGIPYCLECGQALIWGYGE